MEEEKKEVSVEETVKGEDQTAEVSAEETK